VKFYHRTTRAAARAILDGGFRDGRGGSGFLDPLVGVWLSNEPLTENEGARGPAVLFLKIPIAAIRDFEVIEEGKPYREWVVPAGVVNRYRPVVVEEEGKMARRGDGIYQRGKTWWLDFRHDGRRHVARLGKGINRTVAGELASVKRAAILKGEAGIGGRRRKDVAFDDAAKEFLAWAKAEKRPKTAKLYGECLTQLKASFAGRRLSELHPFLIEKHKRARLEAGAKVMPNRELSVLREIFNRASALGTFEGDNPVKAVKRLKESEGRVRFLEPAEEAALMAELHEPHRTLVLVGIHARARGGALAHLAEHRPPAQPAPCRPPSRRPARRAPCRSTACSARRWPGSRRRRRASTCSCGGTGRRSARSAPSS
jgi:hypothetical protein